jgi:hypothetical protein
VYAQVPKALKLTARIDLAVEGLLSDYVPSVQTLI